MSVQGFTFDNGATTEKYDYEYLDNAPVVDRTLSIHGAFADAKRVGDAIDAITPQFTDANSDGNIVITLG